MEEPADERADNNQQTAPPLPVASISLALSQVTTQVSQHLLHAVRSRSGNVSACREQALCPRPAAQLPVLDRPRAVPHFRKQGLLQEEESTLPRRPRYRKRDPIFMAVPEPFTPPNNSALDKLLEKGIRRGALGFGRFSDVPTDAGGSGSLSFDPLMLASSEGQNSKTGVGKGGPKRVLILMSDTGGGHRASAQALKTAFFLEFGTQYEVIIVDMWKEHTPWPFNTFPDSYSFMVKHEWIWKLAFDFSSPKFVHQPHFVATTAFVAREMAKAFVKYKPDIIVSVHPLMQHVPLRVLRSRGLLHRIPFTTVITDLDTCHPTWFHKLVTTCFCPTEKVGERALKAGLQPGQVRVHGLPIRPDFARKLPPREDLRKQLDMHPTLPAVILIGGGEGMGPVETTARALADVLGGGENGQAPLGQLIIICGRNKKLQSILEAVRWPMPTQVQGFVKNMPEWMAASDCVITKAGPGTIAEALIRGLPIVLNDFIAGQETGNVPFVVENGVGQYSEKPAEIAAIVAEWFGEKKGELIAMKERALKLARPDAVFNIVRDLDKLVKKAQEAYGGPGVAYV